MTLGKAKIDIGANLKPLQVGLAKARTAVTSMVKRASSAMKAGFSPSFRLISAGFRNMIRLAKLTALAILGIGIASVKIASDVKETDNLFKISMGSMAESAQRWATEYSKSLGLFENDTRKGLGTFQLMLTSMGIGEKEAFKMSKGLVQLTNDISSFRNQKPGEVFLKLQAGITGEAEPLKRLGILVNENVIKQLALKDATIKARIANEKGRAELKRFGNLVVNVKKKIKGSSFVLTDAEKVMLRYKAIVKATSLDQGDMARTMDDTANVFRVISAQVMTSANTIGKVFLPAVTKAGIAVRDWFINNQPTIEKWATSVNTSIGKVVTKLTEYFELAKQGNFEAIFTDLGEIFAKIIEGLKEAFGEIRPKAIELGSAIAEGFFDAMKKTKVGKFLSDPNTAKELAGFKQLGGSNGNRFNITTMHGLKNERVGPVMGRARTPILNESQLNEGMSPGVKNLLLNLIGVNKMDNGPTTSQEILKQLTLQTKMLTEGNRGI